MVLGPPIGKFHQGDVWPLANDDSRASHAQSDGSRTGVTRPPSTQGPPEPTCAMGPSAL